MHPVVEYFPKVVLMVTLTCFVGIACGYPVAHWIGRKLGDYLSCLPADRFAKAPPAMGIPGTLAMRGDVTGAVAGYEALLETHPHDKAIHFRLLELALGPMHSPAYAGEILDHAKIHLLDREYGSLCRMAEAMERGEFTTYKHLGKPPETTASPLSSLRPPQSGAC